MAINVAFPYVAVSQSMHALYSAIAEGMTANVREHWPDANITQLTDEHTPAIGGVNGVLRIDRTMPLMVWRLKAHQMAHSMADEILFMEPDVRIVSADILDAMQNCDIAIADREIDVIWDYTPLSVECPYTMGATMSRSDEFWRYAKIACEKMGEKDQNWIGDMKAVALAVKSGRFKVTVLDSKIYNHIPNDPAENTEAKIRHYKGKRKQWLIQSGRESEELAA